MRSNQSFGLGLAALALAVAGCERAAEPVVPPREPTAPVVEVAPATANYVCDSGLKVAVAYPDPQTAQVAYRDRTYVLRAAPAASGARFADAEVEWRSLTRDGVERATLSRLVAEDAPVVLEQCSRPAPAAPAAPAVAPPVAPIAPVSGAALPPVATADGTTAPPCKGPQLKLSADGGDAGAGNRVSTLGVQNVGTRACSLTGYPTIIVQDRQGRDLTGIRAEQSLGSYFRTGQAPAPVRLEPQAKALFDIAWNVVPDESQGQRACPSVARIRMTAPGDTSPVSLDQAFTPCGGRIRVSPLRAVDATVP